jgi:type VI secretion system protein ImpA
MAASPTQWHQDLHAELDRALASLAALTEALNTLCGAEAPSLHQLVALLEQIRTLIASELHKRGVSLVPPSESDQPADNVEQGSDVVSRSVKDELSDRAAAYARLAEVADYLQRIEPHSPVPYLLKRAVAWGNLNTAELYQELFVKASGRLDIFEMLGLSVSRPGEVARSAQ